MSRVPARHPIGATNCLNFGNPERPEIMWQLVEAIEGIAEACRALNVPITGGNVSLYNETNGEAIYPTPILGVVGVLDDASKVVARAFRRRRRRCRAARRRLRRARRERISEECCTIWSRVRPPALDLDRERRLIDLLAGRAASSGSFGPLTIARTAVLRSRLPSAHSTRTALAVTSIFRAASRVQGAPRQSAGLERSLASPPRARS